MIQTINIFHLKIKEKENQNRVLTLTSAIFQIPEQKRQIQSRKILGI